MCRSSDDLWSAEVGGLRQQFPRKPIRLCVTFEILCRFDDQRRAVDADDADRCPARKIGTGHSPGTVADADSPLAARKRRVQGEPATDQRLAAPVETGGFPMHLRA